MRGLLEQPLATRTERDRVAEAAASLASPASQKWIAGRIATLLAHYYVRDTMAEIIERVADDWVATLAPYPAWAIQNACRWWIGPENPDARRKPVPGEIAKRVAVETTMLRVATLRIEAFDRRGDGPPAIEAHRDDPLVDERKARVARILAEVSAATSGARA